VTCTAYGRGQRYLQNFGGELEGKSAIGRTRFEWEAILQLISSYRAEGVNWIDLAQSRDRSKVVVNVAINHSRYFVRCKEFLV
jgi:hypothetical protein